VTTAAAEISIKAPQRLLADQVPGFGAASTSEIEKTGAAPDPAAAAKAAPGAGSVRIQIDLAALSQFDSSAVAALVALSRRAAERRLQLRCVNVPPNLRKLAALYGVDGALFDH
jgi:phospholipid transport system transporter-binding protein